MQKFLIFILTLLLVKQGCFAEKIEMYLEHAVAENELAKGLMEKTYLDDNHGMTFNISPPRYLSFWMYNTKINLSIAFLDEKKVIREIFDMNAYPHVKDINFFHNKTTKSSFKASYALEMNKGWFEKNHIKPGDQAFWDTKSPYGFIITK